MIFEYIGLSKIEGSLVVIDHVENASYEEMVELKLTDGSIRHGRVIRIDGKRITVQVFEGTSGLSMENTFTHLIGKPMELPLSPEIVV